MFQGIQFDKAGYCQFLKEQGLTQEQISALIVYLAEMPTHDLYGEDIPMDKVLLGSYIDTRQLLEYAGSRGPKIYLHPEQHQAKHSLNDTLLEETRHYMQDCMGMFPVGNYGEYEHRPEEIDAKEFVCLHQGRQFIREA